MAGDHPVQFVQWTLPCWDVPISEEIEVSQNRAIHGYPKIIHGAIIFHVINPSKSDDLGTLTGNLRPSTQSGAPGR